MVGRSSHATARCRFNRKTTMNTTHKNCCTHCMTATNRNERDKGNTYCGNRNCGCHRRPMTEGETEIASGLDKYFEEEDAKETNTPDTEWSEIKYIVQKYVESKTAQVHALTKLESCIQNLLSSRDTYWKERVRGIPKLIEQHLEYDEDTDTMYFNSKAIKNGQIVNEYKELEKALDTLLDNLK